MEQSAIYPGSASAWSPFGYRTFTIIWIGTVVSDIGGWMSTAASGWLMTRLDSSPFMVSMVQVAISLPIFLLAIPAGALSDIVDRRKFLLCGEVSIMAACVVFALLVTQHLITLVSLLIMLFVVSLGSAMTAPPWQAVVNQLVPKSDLPPAIALNTAGINVSRAIGAPGRAAQLIATNGTFFRGEVFRMLLIDGEDESLATLHEGDQTDSTVFWVLLAPVQIYRELGGGW